MEYKKPEVTNNPSRPPVAHHFCQNNSFLTHGTPTQAQVIYIIHEKRTTVTLREKPQEKRSPEG
jgi:hypothetical protein